MKLVLVFAFTLIGLTTLAAADPVTFTARSAKSGNWSDATTWADGHIPKAGDFVQIRAGHSVVYDVNSDAALRMVHVAGSLSFSHDKSTKLCVGLLKVQRGDDDVTEDGFTCAAHALVEQVDDSKGPLPVLEIGTADQPIPANITATIQLVYFDGTNKETLPAIIDCGGRWDVHGAPMNRTWVKLGTPAKAGDASITLAEPVTGWKVGDQIIVTESKTPEFSGGGHRKPGSDEGSEQRHIVSIDRTTLKLDKPLLRAHSADEEGRVEVANLSRNVVIESANPNGVRGHTMYHRHSTGGISYAEFRHLGKEGILGKYPVHFHLVRDSMRGSEILGASIWDSKNRFMAIHGTDYLLIRDCVGFQSKGHGFFLEDATEQYNVLDRNLAVQCYQGKPLPQQVLDFDSNEGAGFWWANGRNTLTRNVACENDRYGFRYEIGKSHGQPPIMGLRTPKGDVVDRDVRTVPFFRFEDNESHSEGLYSFNFGEDPQGEIHGDKQHPFIARNLRAWQTHYVIRPNLAFFMLDKMEMRNGVYGVYHPDYNAHVYRDIYLYHVESEPINRGHDDESIQYGSFTYDGLTLDKCQGQPLIQLTCTAPVEGLSGHFRNLRVIPFSPDRSIVVDLGVGPILPDKELIKPVPYFFHDSSGGILRVVSVKFPDMMKDGHEYGSIPNFTGPQVRAAKVEGVEFPKLLDPIDDLPPATMITSVRKAEGKLVVTGVTQDNGEVATVKVNGTDATITQQHAGVADWQATLSDGDTKDVRAAATDQAGNAELMTHVRPIVQ